MTTERSAVVVFMRMKQIRIHFKEEIMSVYQKDGKVYLIIGNGPAGHFAAGEIRKKDPDGRIIITGREKERTYLRTQLAECFSAELPEDKFYMVKEEWYEKNEVEQILSMEASSIDKEDKVVTFRDGSQIHYDKLIIATGSYNFIPPVDVEIKRNGKTVDVMKVDRTNFRNYDGLFSIREHHDTIALQKRIRASKQAVVIGGGLLGLEAAWSLKKCGLDVTVIEFFNRLLPRQLDEESSEVLKNMALASGVKLILEDSLESITIEEDEDGNQNLASVRLQGGDTLDCQIVLFSVGVRSRAALAAEAGIEVNKGIVVNTRMETSAEDIYACGDVAEINNFVYGTWPSALNMGRVAGTNAAGGDLKFPPMVLSTMFTSMNAKVFSAGNVDFCDPGLDILEHKSVKKGEYKKLFFRDDKLVAGILLGDTKRSTRIVKGIEDGYTEEEALKADIL